MRMFVALLAILPMAGCYDNEKLVDCADPTELDDVVELCDLRFELRPDEEVMVVVEAGRRPFEWSHLYASAHQSVDVERRVCVGVNDRANDSGDACVAMSGWVQSEHRLGLGAVSQGPIQVGDRLGFCVSGDAEQTLRLGIGLEYGEAEGNAYKTYRGFTHGDLGPVQRC